jgi:hypothetical protein
MLRRMCKHNTCRIRIATAATAKIRPREIGEVSCGREIPPQYLESDGDFDPSLPEGDCRMELNMCRGEVTCKPGAEAASFQFVERASPCSRRAGGA